MRLARTLSALAPCRLRPPAGWASPLPRPRPLVPRPPPLKTHVGGTQVPTFCRARAPSTGCLVPIPIGSGLSGYPHRITAHSLPLTIQIVSDIVCPWCYVARGASRRRGRAAGRAGRDHLVPLPATRHAPRGQDRREHYASIFGEERGRQYLGSHARDGRGRRHFLQTPPGARSPNTCPHMFWARTGPPDTWRGPDGSRRETFCRAPRCGRGYRECSCTGRHCQRSRHEQRGGAEGRGRHRRGRRKIADRPGPRGASPACRFSSSTASTGCPVPSRRKPYCGRIAGPREMSDEQKPLKKPSPSGSRSSSRERFGVLFHRIPSRPGRAHSMTSRRTARSSARPVTCRCSSPAASSTAARVA